MYGTRALACAFLSIALSSGAAEAVRENGGAGVDMSPLAAGSFGPASSDAQGAAMVEKLVAKWGGVMRNFFNWDESAFARFRAGYRNYPQGVLQAALDAVTFQQMTGVLDRYTTLKAQDTLAKAFPARKSYALNALHPEDADNAQVVEAQKSAAKALGEDAKDLVFIPITPCTVWDTRFAQSAPYAGAIGDGVTRQFFSHADDSIVFSPPPPGSNGFSFYGGNPSCPQATVSYLGGHPYAVVMTVYVNNPVGNGWLTFYRDGDADPSTATISMYYSPGPTRTQTVFSKSSRGYGTGAYDIAVTGRYGTADAAASVTGYFMKPQATALDCTTVEEVGAGQANVAPDQPFYLSTAAVCPAGFTRTAVSCIHAGPQPAGLALVQSGGDNGDAYHACDWRNESSQTLNGADFKTYSRCCSVPGH